MPNGSPLKIIHYPHPTLKRVSKRLKRVDAELKKSIAAMFELMYATAGVGLAANQVDLPYRFFVMNESGEASRKELERVFINPVLSQHKGSVEQEEGCLSLPEVFAPVRRPKTVTIDAYDLTGQEVHLKLDQLPARVVQHEVDHLDGILFIERLAPTVLAGIREKLRDFEIDFDSRRAHGEIPSDEEIARNWQALEALRA